MKNSKPEPDVPDFSEPGTFLSALNWNMSYCSTFNPKFREGGYSNSTSIPELEGGFFCNFRQGKYLSVNYAVTRGSSYGFSGSANGRLVRRTHRVSGNFQGICLFFRFGR